MSGTIEVRLHSFIVEELLEEDVGDRDPLASDAVDSLGLEQVIEFISEEWGVELDTEDIVNRNLKSVAALASLVEGALAARRS